MFPTTAEVEILVAAFEEIDGWWNYADLAAPYWRLYANLSTGASVRLSGKVTPLRPGFGYLIPPETPFTAIQDAPVGHFYVHFTVSEPFTGMEPQIIPFTLTQDERSARDRLAAVVALRRVNGAVIAAGTASDSERAETVCAVAALVFGALSRVAAAAPPPRKLDLRIQAVLRAIDEARDRAPSNKELAAVAAMHPDSLIRLFREETGETPAARSLRRRIERACVLLAHSDRTIKEIAALCGFRDRNYFSTAFARERGRSPARWRAEQGGIRGDPGYLAYARR